MDEFSHLPAGIRQGVAQHEQEIISGTAGDVPMEVEIPAQGLLGNLGSWKQAVETIEFAEIGLGSTGSHPTGERGLHQAAGIEDELQPAEGIRGCAGEGAYDRLMEGVGDADPDPMANLDQPLRLETLGGLAEDRPADAEPLGELAFGREPAIGGRVRREEPAAGDLQADIAYEGVATQGEHGEEWAGCEELRSTLGETEEKQPAPRRGAGFPVADCVPETWVQG